MAISLFSVMKGFYRYAQIPARRFGFKGKPLRVLFARKLSNKVLADLFPGELIRSNNGVPKAAHFYLTWAPWLLSDPRSKIYHSVPLPAHIRKFCVRFNIHTEDITKTRRKIPSSYLQYNRQNERPKAGKSPVLKGSADTRTVPDWYRAHPTDTTKDAVSSDSKLFLYVPWIAEHGDVLIGRIQNPGYKLIPFDMMKDVDNNAVRRDIQAFARTNPDLYRRMVIRRLVPLQSKISGFILTFDWAPVMRIIASVCRELNIPTILIPHESVFVDRDKYYWDAKSYASVPVCDVVLGWGELQREIFAERGYPDERFLTVGAPKFDTYYQYEPKLSREQLHNLFGLDAKRKTILFASQPLDSQLDTKTARSSQRRAISDLLRYAEERGAQLIVRLPPSKDDILGSELRKALLSSPFGAYDDATCYLVSPEEALYHCDVVTSINSTMLFEGLLAGRSALSMKYVEFDQIWEKAGVPAATSIEEAEILLDEMLRGDWIHDESGMDWAAHSLGVGKFDGQAAARIGEFLTSVTEGQVTLLQREKAYDLLQKKAPLDVVAIASSERTLSGLQSNLPVLLNARQVQSSQSGDLVSLASVDLFLQWGITPNKHKEQQKLLARMLAKPVVTIEDGFIRSMEIGLDGTPALAIILDQVTAYYDATQQSQLEKNLQDGRDLTDAEMERAKAAIHKIVSNQVTKYNHAPRIPVSVGRPGVPKVLVIDQRAGDQSIASGLASDESFMLMLQDAIANHPYSDVIIKRHPDAISGGKIGYFSNDLEYVPSEHRDRVFLFDAEMNPYTLVEEATDVYVVTSMLGLEALMAGKIVHCYGVPFYSGWGCTQDHVQLERRNRIRSVEEIFHFAYIEASRYTIPRTFRLVEVEEITDYIISVRDRPAVLDAESDVVSSEAESNSADLDAEGSTVPQAESEQVQSSPDAESGSPEAENKLSKLERSEG